MQLPFLISCKISNFSLYGGIDEVVLDLDKPTIVLAGANGLGKSTFLNIIAFALTGKVKDFNYKFKGIYDIESMNFTEEYFAGRIDKIDESVAKVELRFRIGDKKVTIIRKFEENGKFYSFQINNDAENLSEQAYKNFVVKEVGLNNFEQFIFLVQYVFLFDESREMIFWNTKLLTSAISILLGIDPEVAEQADELTKRINSLDSDYRNTSWQISKIRNYVKDLESELDIDNQQLADNLIEEYEELINNEERLDAEMRKLNFEISAIKALVAELSAKEFAIKKEYDKNYEMLFNESNSIDRITKNEYIAHILESNECLLCGSNAVNHKLIIDKLEHKCCPLCLSDIKQNKVEIDVTELEKLDTEIERIRKKLQNALMEQEQLIQKLNNIKEKVNNIQIRIHEIKANPNYKKSIEYIGNNKTIKNVLEQNNQTINLLERKKEEFKSERDKYKKESEKLRSIIADEFNNIKDQFIPIFNELAYQFIGLDINLILKEINNYHRAEFQFILQIDESDRLFVHQLSESQKFFIDIALRMAFIIYIRKQNKNNGGFLLLDTPEGSLDIAYETNAGVMLCKYTSNGTQLLMTANINSSGLLLSLAKNSNEKDLSFVRMINWAKLSKVQTENLEMIEGILDDLEKEVGKGYESRS